MSSPGILYTIVAFFLIIGPLIFIHEMGHYLAGRWFGVKAETFSIGFGRELFGWTDKRGTRWKIGWLPLGGYVKFAGDMTPASSHDEAGLPPRDGRIPSRPRRLAALHHRSGGREGIPVRGYGLRRAVRPSRRGRRGSRSDLPAARGRAGFHRQRGCASTAGNRPLEDMIIHALRPRSPSLRPAALGAAADDHRDAARRASTRPVRQ